jgi:hypothetical protein
MNANKREFFAARTLSGVRGARGNFKRVFDEWVKINTRLANDWAELDDVPWWYNERASLSLLAGAVWLCEGMAFEEYAADKKNLAKRIRYRGRSDMYFFLGGKHYMAEAKWHWSGATRSDKETAKTIQSKLRNALNDVRKQPGVHGQTKLGILFVTPYISCSKGDRVDELIHAWLRELKRVKCSRVAWVFPESARHMASGKWICPGVAVLIQETR